MEKPNIDNVSARREPFKAPEGYLESLTDRVMAAINARTEAAPAAEPKPARLPFHKTTLYAKLKPYIYMAAMFGGLYFGIWVFKYQQKLINDKAQAAAILPAADNTDGSTPSAEEMADYIDDACDYMMVNSHDILAYVSNDEL